MRQDFAFWLLLALVVVLGTTTSYLALGKSDKASAPTTKQTQQETGSAIERSRKPASIEPLSSPQKIYQVKEGETLHPIGLSLGVPWPTLAQANALSEPYVIYPGRELFVPEKDPATGRLGVAFAPKDLSGIGADDPVEAAARDAQGVYGLTDQATFSLLETKEKQTRVRGLVGQNATEIILTQPTGPGGPWVISWVFPLSPQ